MRVYLTGKQLTGIVVKEKINMGLEWRENGIANCYPIKGKTLKAESLKKGFDCNCQIDCYDSDPF